MIKIILAIFGPFVILCLYLIYQLWKLNKEARQELKKVKYYPEDFLD